jgi:hypothetical protein
MAKLKEIDESQYKVDFDILNGYINFSSELLRLSLFAMGGFGALVLIKIKGEEKLPGFLHQPIFFLFSMLFFALCAGAALFHRYFASDSMSWYIAWLRADAAGNTEAAISERKGFHRMLKFSAWALISAEILFGVGVLFFIIAMFRLFYGF